MSKEELRDLIEALPATILENEKYGVSEILISQSKVLEFVDQLEEPEVLIAERTVEKEPEKPVVPSFAAEWIEECKKENRTLSDAYERLGIVDVIKWLYHDGDRHEKVDLFARAWLDGYTVEEEKHPVLKAFDEKAKEYENYESTSQRLQEMRKVIVKAIEEEKVEE